MRDVRGALILVTTLVLFAGAPARADYYDGLRAFDAGNIDAAISEWRSAALQGDVLAQKRLGDIYVQGRNVRQDFIEAHMWYNLGAVNPLTYISDPSGRPPQEARKARDDARDARNRLQALMTADDIDTARRRLVRVFESGGPQMLYILGGLYQRGAGVPQNSVEAYRYFIIAAALGVDEAIRARDILAANLKPEQVAAAQRAAKDWQPPPSPFEDGGSAGGGYTSAPLQPKLIQHALRALNLYSGPVDGALGAGSQAGIRAFQRQIGVKPTGKLSLADAVRLVEAAAQDGDAVSQNTLGSLYAEGIGKPRDARAARQWFEASARQGFASAEFNLGVVYRDGLGVTRDRDRARDYFRRARDGGHPAAGRALRELERTAAVTP